MTDLLKEPSDLEEAAESYSNFDHAIPHGAEDLLRNGKHWMQHCAWDHWGAIWFADGQFHERVMRYCAHVATISASTLDELVYAVNEEYGAD